MTDLKLPISAPGATDAAAGLDKVAVSVEALAKSKAKYEAGLKREAAYQAELNKQMKEAAAAQAVFERRVAKTAERWSKEADAGVRNATAMRRARNEMMGAEGDVLSNRAQRKLLNMIPGGRILDDIGDVAGGAKGGGRLIAGFGVLTVALLAGAAVFRANSEAVERANQSMLENMKINNDMARQAKATFDAQQAEAAKSFGSIRNAARFILGSQGKQGQGDVAQALNLGGPDAVNALAEALKSKGIKSSGITGAGLLSDAQRISDTTGVGIADVLKEFSKQKGRYNPDKTIKELTGGVSPELWAMFSESGMATDLGGQISDYDAIQAKLAATRAGKTMNRGLVLGGAMNELDSVMNPFKKAIDDHNAKIREEIAMKDALIGAERSMVDFWIENIKLLYGPLELARNALGIESTAMKADRERKTLLKQLR